MDRGRLFSLIPLIPLALGGIFLAMGVHGIRRARRLRRTGAEARGSIVRHDTSSAQNNGTLYHPVAAWYTPDGHYHEHVPRVGRSWKGRFKVGTPVLIHYDPSDPTSAALHGYDGAGPDRFLTVLGALLIAGALAVLTAVLLN